VNTAVQSKR